MNWKAGDRAILVGLGGVEDGRDVSVFNGEEVHITSCPYLHGFMEVVDIEMIDNYWKRADVTNLRPIDDYDGHEITSWEECIWQPKVMA